MDGFQTFASSRGGGVCFSVGGAMAARSFAFAVRLQVRDKAAAHARTVALTPGGIFMPDSLGKSKAVCQDFPVATFPHARDRHEAGRRGVDRATRLTVSSRKISS